MQALNDFSSREFPMTDGDFARIKSIAYTLTGINLSDHKKNMIYGRLARRLRKLDLTAFHQYCDIISEEDSSEHKEFINSITTNLTSFFRESHHFTFLRDQAIPKLLQENSKTKRIRIWSAGCSTGEEPYSIAMVLKTCSALNNWDVKILATDLDTNVVQKGKDAVYSVERVENIPAEYKRFLASNPTGELVKVKDAARDLISFRQLNLLKQWPMKGPFDIIFCRNVVIYFDAETQKKLFDRYADILTPNGILIIGHSENLHNVSKRFSSLGRTIYARSV